MAAALGVVSASLAALFAGAAVKEARNTNASQNRAYLTVKFTEIIYAGRTSRALPNGGRDAYVIRVWVRNSGRTPAKWFKAKCRLSFVKYDVNMNSPQVVATHEEETKAWVGMAADEDVSFMLDGMDYFNVISQAIDDAVDGSSVVLECEISYQTMFDKKAQMWATKTAARAERLADYATDYRQSRIHDTPRPDPLKMPFSPVEVEPPGVA
ncbi:hypothetical protein JHW40_11805 [Paracoccus alcaliphilus]|nr:hypothetical protein JHW40_11805 [Paracoccus alcaliphilus]